MTEKKKIWFPNLDNRTTLEIRMSNDPPDYLIVHIKIDDMETYAVWCDAISVFKTKPPTFSLKYKEFGVVTLAASMTYLSKKVVSRLNFETTGYIKKYIKVLE